MPRPVRQHHRVQHAADVRMAHPFDIAAVGIHDKLLQGVGVAIIGGPGRNKALAIAREHIFAARQRARLHALPG